MCAHANGGHNRGAEASDVGVVDPIERTSKAIGPNLRPKIRARAAAGVKEPGDDLAGRGV